MLKLPFFRQSLKNAPEFYQEYAQAFSIKKKKGLPLEEIRFVIFDVETTGINPRKDRMLSLGAIGLRGNVLSVDDILEVYVEQEVFDVKSVSIHGLLKKGNYDRITEEEAVKRFLKFAGSAVLVGHHVGFDIAIINYALKRLGAPKLKNKALDTEVIYKKTIHQVNVISPEKRYSLDELCEELKIPQADRHKAAGDAYITALAFLKIRSRMDMKGQLTYKDLTR